MDKHLIMGVHVTDRLQEVPAVQQLLTQFGGHIKTRLGLHEATGQKDSPAGMLILEMVGEESAFDTLAQRLNEIEGVETQKMVFGHP